MFDVVHPQTILAYGLNGEDLPLGNGAPVRLRVERQCGYKNVKFLKTLQVVDSIAGFGRGHAAGISADYGIPLVRRRVGAGDPVARGEGPAAFDRRCRALRRRAPAGAIATLAATRVPPRAPRGEACPASPPTGVADGRPARLGSRWRPGCR